MMYQNMPPLQLLGMSMKVQKNPRFNTVKYQEKNHQT